MFEWKPFVPEPLEFRLYFDDNGKVVCYTTEKPEGNYIVVERQIYLEARTDIRVVNGEIIKSQQGAVITKLVPSNSGIRCATHDVNIIVPEDYTGPTIVWDTQKYEFKYN